jgi:hypothetical protein
MASDRLALHSLAQPTFKFAENCPKLIGNVLLVSFLAPRRELARRANVDPKVALSARVLQKWHTSIASRCRLHVIDFMVRALGLEPRTNALKDVFDVLQGVAIICIACCKSIIYSAIVTD